jgi:hypothetical protein
MLPEILYAAISLDKRLCIPPVKGRQSIGTSAITKAYLPKPSGPNARAKIILVPKPIGIDIAFIALTPRKLLINCFFKLNLYSFLAQSA